MRILNHYPLEGDCESYLFVSRESVLTSPVDTDRRMMARILAQSRRLRLWVVTFSWGLVHRECIAGTDAIRSSNLSIISKIISSFSEGVFGITFTRVL
nr:MAG: hypothetical protein H1Bulk3093192_000002 [Mitovirus sp.]